jgi:hypothetical protein
MIAIGPRIYFDSNDDEVTYLVGAQLVFSSRKFNDSSEPTTNCVIGVTAFLPPPIGIPSWRRWLFEPQSSPQCRSLTVCGFRFYISTTRQKSEILSIPVS